MEGVKAKEKCLAWRLVLLESGSVLQSERFAGASLLLPRSYFLPGRSDNVPMMFVSWSRPLFERSQLYTQPRTLCSPSARCGADELITLRPWRRRGEVSGSQGGRFAPHWAESRAVAGLRLETRPVSRFARSSLSWSSD